MHDSIDRQGRHAAAAELGNDVFAVRDDRRQSDIELVSYLLISRFDNFFSTLGSACGGKC